MAKKERKLSQKELERKARFDAVCEEMAQKGYRKQDLTVGVVAANVGALVVMLPFLALAAWAYYRVNSGVISAFSPLVLPAAWLLSLSGDVNMVWWAFPIAELASLLFSALFLRHIYKKEILPLDKPRA